MMKGRGAVPSFSLIGGLTWGNKSVVHNLGRLLLRSHTVATAAAHRLPADALAAKLNPAYQVHVEQEMTHHQPKHKAGEDKLLVQHHKQHGEVRKQHLRRIRKGRNEHQVQRGTSTDTNRRSLRRRILCLQVPHKPAPKERQAVQQNSNQKRAKDSEEVLGLGVHGPVAEQVQHTAITPVGTLKPVQHDGSGSRAELGRVRGACHVHG
mmetsp:Transcript_74257/g.86178  ORF Transcript_74257/g.86178 Transcript_74257/m.86178 type:complete len:208 (+) Transcript_74257:670-1293(+)